MNETIAKITVKRDGEFLPYFLVKNPHNEESAPLPIMADEWNCEAAIFNVNIDARLLGGLIFRNCRRPRFEYA